MPAVSPFPGAWHTRVDGALKVTGRARYAGDFPARALAHGWVVSAAIAKGSIARIDMRAALAVRGVLRVYTHKKRPGAAWFNYKYHDAVGPPGRPFRPLRDGRIHFSGQPIALVVAEDLETARYAASLVRVEYRPDAATIDVERVRESAAEPAKRRSGPPPEPRGDAAAAMASAPLHVDHEYRVAIEHHNPMELQATTVEWQDDGKITVHDKTQGVLNTRSYVSAVFGLTPDKVHVVAPYVGGAFGIGLRPQYQLFLAVMAALDLQRSVRVTLTRDQGFSVSYRPDTLQRVALGADRDGHLQAVMHDAIAGTSRFEEHQESVVDWSGLAYQCDNVKLTYRLARIDTPTPTDMRAPGATLGVYALESAMDELAHAAAIDPIELRLRNYAERDQNEDKPFTSKELRNCYQEGARRFGWDRRSAAPRSMRDGHELIGWGMAGGIWEAMFTKTSARASVERGGHVEIGVATSDIGTGTYTVLSQIAAHTLGIPIERVSVKLGDSSLPQAPVEGGSWTATSAGSAVAAACEALRNDLFKSARRIKSSPLSRSRFADLRLVDDRIQHRDDHSRAVTLADVLQAAGVEKLEANKTAKPSLIGSKRAASYTHSAIFAEVRVDEELGVVRVTRVVNAVAAGKILNPITARSQILGGVVMGIGMALFEETQRDDSLARFMNRNLAEYHLASNADIRDIDVVFVDEQDDRISPLGAKGLGEIGIVGTAAAIANAIFHATGRRVRELPVTLDKLL
ncbi:MAG TPA: xanthine dehydrogenase family protein molybdopterin-binding subunit [Casimicrobiaceae bacterium]